MDPQISSQKRFCEAVKADDLEEIPLISLLFKRSEDYIKSPIYTALQ